MRIPTNWDTNPLELGQGRVRAVVQLLLEARNW